jgi:hypothetical protein
MFAIYVRSFKSGRARNIFTAARRSRSDEIPAKLKSGEIEIVVNCMVLAKAGISRKSLWILADRLKALVYRQMIDGLRPFPGKEHLPFSIMPAVAFTVVSRTYRCELDTDHQINRAHEARQADHRSRLTTCPKCSALRTAGEACRSCGWKPQPRIEHFDIQDGDLARIDRNRLAHQHVYSAEDKRRWHAMFVYISQERGYGYFTGNYMQKFGHWPQGWDAPVPAPPPDAEVRSWVKSRMIRLCRQQPSSGVTA